MPWLEMLRCVGCCRSGLVVRGGMLDCPGCGCSYPVQADVPVMLRDARPSRGPLLEPGTVRDLLTRLAVPVDPFTTMRARQASGARVRLGVDSAPPADGRLLGRAALPTVSASEGAPGCRWVREFLPRAMQPGQEALANVRFCNDGDGVMSCAGSSRVMIAVQWQTLDGVMLGQVAGGEVRTPLPVDVAPGVALSVPVRLVAPSEAGDYGLRLAMVQEGVRWLEPALGPVRVSVHAGARFALPSHWVLDGLGPHEATAQREAGIAMLRQSLSAVDRPAVVEVCGGATPAAVAAVGALGGPTWNVDGDLLALQLGCMVPRAGAEVRPVCADPSDMPLQAGRLDAAVSFGALHCQDDPVAVLRTMREMLRPGGFIGLFCEPVGQIWPGAPAPAVLAALRRGQNEQGFSLAEWAMMFGAARLVADELTVTGPTMTARLRPEGAHA